MTSVNSAEPGFVVRTGERVIAADSHGDPDGRVVVGLHGTPGSRRSALPATDLLRQLGLRYLTYDRPGYGRSSRAPGRTVFDAVADIGVLLDHLGADRCVVVGGSGGAPHALACAAGMPDRVVGVTVVVPPAPIDLIGSDAYFAGMDAGTAQLFRLAYTGGAEAVEPALVQALAGAGLPAGDESLRQGVVGMVDDLVALHRPWAFDLGEVRAPVDIWFGVDDENAPAAHARWLAAALPEATLHPQQGDHSWPATKMAEIFTAAARHADDR
ncbi:alpha/beta fold hydrolase [Virgisporangium aurantiacum]|uniref:Alpha/beta hydrolase n=1 Tax=Virgisporangium aurantiacum TaxID=175570 RepID=A0A8J3ZG46_9ACTN|nr:alpha/beta hydrolase [Virgisporangium aurantiacum]GIJ61245.1 alpha/beta hydrolase [Virgisporangium aurantiacum]